jgi:hypothetical protein
VIVRIELLRLILIATGASSLDEGGAPVGASALAAIIPAAETLDGPPRDSPRLQWRTRRDGVGVELDGANPCDLATIQSQVQTFDLWSSFLSVRVVVHHNAGSKEAPALWGSYRLESGSVRFVPRFPLEPGLCYCAEFDPVALHVIAQGLRGPPSDLPRGHPSGAKLIAELSLPKQPVGSTTRVAAVYPTADVLPENLLRCYIYFSAPMSRGEAYRHIKLIDAKNNKLVDSPFLELGEELWSPDGARFTLLFDPGRIKRGLRPREQAGPILEAGKSYALLIERDWPDAFGNPLSAEFRKSFRAGQPDQVPPDPKNWSLRVPRPDTRGSLELRFPEPMDRALLDRLISIEDAVGERVAGQISLADHETLWRFAPQAPWRAGDFRIAIGTELEDLAGNSVARPFEVDITSPISKRVDAERMDLPFRIDP